MALYSLAEHCGYGNLHDEMIRDRIVVGIRNSSLSEKLQLDAWLTLDRAITTIEQCALLEIINAAKRVTSKLFVGQLEE